MKIDLDLVNQSLENKILPTIRFYQWQPFAISLGHHQSIETINLEKCKFDGVDVVKRSTGGSAVFHSEELTYSIVLSGRELSLQKTYSEISNALILGLKLLGINADCKQSELEYLSPFKNQNEISCFNSTSKYEIQFEGKKIIGSAQRIFRKKGINAILQHGSILLGPKYLEIINYLNFNSEFEKKDLLNNMRRRTINISKARNKKTTPNEVIEKFVSAFKQSWGIEKFEITKDIQLINKPKLGQEQLVL
ncbi:MAG: hypothetical protein O3A55_05805 [Bacteroidetes bacterium]|nr:hypothetical protein [Bacteroidota bacterium]